MLVHFQLQNLLTLLNEDLLYLFRRDGGNVTENAWEVPGKYAIYGPTLKMNFL